MQIFQIIRKLSKTTILFLVMVSAFLTLPSLQAAENAATEAPFSFLVEGSGEIKAGDTLQARNQAVASMLKSALSNSVGKLMNGNAEEYYGAMLEDNLFGHAQAFIKTFRIEEELGEASIFRVRAKVDVDGEKLTQELRNHGLIGLPNNLQKPKLLFFIQQPLSKAGNSWGWWLDMAQLPPNYVQDFFKTRLERMPLQLIDWRSLLMMKAGPEVDEALKAIKNNTTASTDQFLKLGTAIQADYIVFGTASADLQECDLQVARTEDLKFVGRLSMSGPTWRQLNFPAPAGPTGSMRRLDAIVYRLVGMVLANWQDRWQIERRVLVHFSNVEDLKTYTEIIKAFSTFNFITAVHEDFFERHSFSVKLAMDKTATELAPLLEKLPILKNRTQIVAKDEKTIEVTLR